MTKTSKFLTSAAIGLAAVGLAVSAPQDSTAAGDKEKCYGVVKAGKNDCGSKVAGHSCAGQAKEDALGHEFIALPKGICERLAGGSTKPSEG